MTLAGIHAMFTPGEIWIAVNSYNPQASGVRALLEKRPTQLLWHSEAMGEFFMPFPRKSQVIAARDGLLSFRLWPDKEWEVTLRRVECGSNRECPDGRHH